MKTIRHIALLGLFLAAVSCRTATPINPMTMSPDPSCLPDSQTTTVIYSK